MRKYLFFLVIFILLLAGLLAGCKSKPQAVEIEEKPEILVIQPDFQVISISVIKGELINTKFEAVLRIENPNDFALNLSTLKYELYGNGDFWASGTGFDILHIPAGEASETDFQFSMNFIDMSRRLLDDIIALRQVQFRFSGAVEVAPVLPCTPSFYMTFERSGLSGVRARAEDRPANRVEAPVANNVFYMDNW